MAAGPLPTGARGDEPLPRLCVQHLRAKDRVVVTFDGRTAWVLLVGPHEEGDRRTDIATALYQLADVDLPETPRSRPPSCDEDDQPPTVDGPVLDDLVRRARSLHR